MVWVALPIYDSGTASAVGPGTMIPGIWIFCSWGILTERPVVSQSPAVSEGSRGRNRPEPSMRPTSRASRRSKSSSQPLIHSTAVTIKPGKRRAHTEDADQLRAHAVNLAKDPFRCHSC